MSYVVVEGESNSLRLEKVKPRTCLKPFMKLLFVIRLSPTFLVTV